MNGLYYGHQLFVLLTDFWQEVRAHIVAGLFIFILTSLAGLVFRKLIREKLTALWDLFREKLTTLWYSFQLFTKKTDFPFFQIDGYKVEYRPLINNWHMSFVELSRKDLLIDIVTTKFDLDDAFNVNIEGSADVKNEPRCRLNHYKKIKHNHLELTFQKTFYMDYLKSGECLDFIYPGRKKSYREVFRDFIEQGDPKNFPLTNICGSGIFLITNDRKIIYAKHKENSRVYPGRNTFTASGVLNWNLTPYTINPFTQVMEKCAEETGHRVNEKDIRLVSFGADNRKLYFQFSFYEKLHISSKAFLEQYDNYLEENNFESNLVVLDFTLEKVIGNLVDNIWEPAAEATLLTICAREFSKRKVRKMLKGKRNSWWKRALRDEWDYRASRPLVYANLSLRYPEKDIEKLSEDNVKQITKFICDDGENISGKTVLEIGSGTGRVTKEVLAHTPKATTCVEISEQMIKRHKSRIGWKLDDERGIVYVNDFFEEWDTRNPIHYDIAICSLVLIHTEEIHGIIKNLCLHSDVIYIFEDVNQRQTSDYTFIRSKEQIVESFTRFGTHFLTKEENHSLASDNIVFLKFIPNRFKDLSPELAN